MRSGRFLPGRARKDVHRMRLFDVLGPVMIGPSSSHTAGAARIGYTAQKLLGEIPAQADIGLYGSFATTGKGHGTDKALVAGLLGLRPDDPRLPDSFALAAEQGMAFRIHPVELRSAHPNTAVLTLTGREATATLAKLSLTDLASKISFISFLLSIFPSPASFFFHFFPPLSFCLPAFVSSL